MLLTFIIYLKCVCDSEQLIDWRFKEKSLLLLKGSIVLKHLQVFQNLLFEYQYLIFNFKQLLFVYKFNIEWVFLDWFVFLWLYLLNLI